MSPESKVERLVEGVVSVHKLIGRSAMRMIRAHIAPSEENNTTASDLYKFQPPFPCNEYEQRPIDKT